jgi:hypothetical protein
MDLSNRSHESQLYAGSPDPSRDDSVGFGVVDTRPLPGFAIKYVETHYHSLMLSGKLLETGTVICPKKPVAKAPRSLRVT